MAFNVAILLIFHYIHIISCHGKNQQNELQVVEFIEFNTQLLKLSILGVEIFMAIFLWNKWKLHERWKKGWKPHGKNKAGFSDEEIPLGDSMDPDLIFSFPCILKPTDKIPSRRKSWCSLLCKYLIKNLIQFWKSWGKNLEFQAGSTVRTYCLFSFIPKLHMKN